MPDHGLLLLGSLDTSHSVGLLWTSEEPVAKTSTWQRPALTTDKHPCLRQSQ